MSLVYTSPVLATCRQQWRIACQPLVRSSSTFAAPEAMLEAVKRSKPWPPWLKREMRSNWAGETGAVGIYRGCLAAFPRHVGSSDHRDNVARDLKAFVSEHVAAEEAHLAAMSVVVNEPSERSWMPAYTFGWCLGYLSTAFRGARGMYMTTHAVESFVEEHYGHQIIRLERELHSGSCAPAEAYVELLALLRAACADEVIHKEHALHNIQALGGSIATADRIHFAVVYWGSRAGAAVARCV